MKAYDVIKLAPELKSSNSVGLYRNTIYYIVSGFARRVYEKHIGLRTVNLLPYDDCWA